jgi:hypothetical protein
LFDKLKLYKGPYTKAGAEEEEEEEAVNPAIFDPMQ